MPALHERLGQAELAELHGTHGAVPDRATLNFAELLRELLAELAGQNEHVHKDRQEHDPEPAQDINHLLAGSRHDQGDDDKHEGPEHQVFAQAEARIHVVAGVALLRPLVAQGQELLVTGVEGLAHLRPLVLDCLALSRLGGLAVLGHQGPFAGCFLGFALGRGRTLAQRGILPGCRFSGLLVYCLLRRRRFLFTSEHFNRIPCSQRGFGAGIVFAMTPTPAANPSDAREPGPGHPAGVINADALRLSVTRSFDATLDRLKELVAIPGIAWPSFDPAPLEASAQAVAELLRAAGLKEVQVLRSIKEDGTPGGPAVVARRQAANGKPTILLYAHHDVQPPGDPALWETEPFAAVERDGRLYGRGAADDKAGIMAHVAAYAAAAEVLGREFGLGVTFFFEGEEEAGSPTFRSFLETHRELLRADVIVVADSSNWKVGIPALTTSLRGLVDGTIEVQVLEHAVHSGLFGGPVLDAPTLLSRLIATFHDEQGNVAIAGLVSSETVGVELTEAEYRADSSVLDGVRLAGTGSIAARLWTKPALSIIGFDAPAVDVASNTLLPRARAKFSLRLAPGQAPAAAMEAMRRHVEANGPFGAKVVFTPGESGNPFLADTSSTAAKFAMWALGEAWGVPAVEMGIGGSIPFIADLMDLYPDVQILVTGVEDPDSRAHSANESLHIGDFRNAIVAEALLLARLNAEGLA